MYIFKEFTEVGHVFC